MGSGQMGVEDGKKRCFGNRPGQNLLAAYHDTEWGVPVHDDRLLFEMLTLEGVQAGELGYSSKEAQRIQAGISRI